MKIKCTLVGDQSVGKTSLLQVFSLQEFPKDYIPTVFANYQSIINIDEEQIELALWDTAGDEDYDRLRPLSYPGTDIVLLCYAINNPQSIINIIQKWAPEVKHHLPTVPTILVGTKNDLCLSSKNAVQINYAEQIAQQIGAQTHFLCSAALNQNVFPLMDEIARMFKSKERKVKKKCF
ncbi:Rac/Rho-like_protein [Hexamita inflata]|uniref:Rac/Rho-like protein n=1 Tax=Hexamita inflata TaxID=28002 RepID=A0AA86QCE5_9EUKA|nr:Rac/Rho-like protein [Hexamita inflata]